MIIITIQNVDTKEFFFTKNHCQNHQLGDKWVPCTYSLPIKVKPRIGCEEGLVKDKSTLLAVFYKDCKEIPNPQPLIYTYNYQHETLAK